MLDLNNRPVAPVREIDPIAEIIAKGEDLSTEEQNAAAVGQAELDEQYLAAFAAYEKADEEYCELFAKETGAAPQGERATREPTQKERNEAGGGKGKPDDEAGNSGKVPPGQAKK